MNKEERSRVRGFYLVCTVSRFIQSRTTYLEGELAADSIFPGAGVDPITRE